MKKKILLGALAGVGVGMFLRYREQKAAFAPASVPIGNLITPDKPSFFLPVVPLLSVNRWHLRLLVLPQ